MTIDVERLRMDLLDYFGTAISYNSLAIMEVAKISNASDEEIVRMQQSVFIFLFCHYIKSLCKSIKIISIKQRFIKKISGAISN